MKTKKHKSSQKRQFAIESLENRRLMAGDVGALLNGNTLYLYEATNHFGEANDVIVSQLPNGQIRVAANQGHAPGSTVNNMPYADITIPAGQLPNLSVDFGGGNDVIQLNNVKLNALDVNMSKPNAAGYDIDTVDLEGVTAQGNVNIKTGDGVDNVYVMNSHIGNLTPGADLNINTGRGWDAVVLGSATAPNYVNGSINIQTYDAATETDGSLVDVEHTMARDNIFTSLDNGADVVNMRVSSAGGLKEVFLAGVKKTMPTYGKIKIQTGGGADTVTLFETSAQDTFFLDLGAGDDKLDITNCQGANFAANGGEGVDRVTHQLDSGKPMNFTGFEFVNNVNQNMPTTTGIGGTTVGTLGNPGTTNAATSLARGGSTVGANGVGTKAVGSKSLLA